MESMRWQGDHLCLLDQTRLPGQIAYLECHDYREVAEAIKRLAVRGAPAIGAAAAYGLALAARQCPPGDLDRQRKYLRQAAQELAATRPTAVNLFWALDRVERAAECCTLAEDLAAVVLAEADRILTEDVAVNRAIGRLGADLIPAGASVLTHCNAGALATGGYGTALGMIRAAHEAGKKIQVYADETRPLLQGARLTAYELMQDGVPVTLITDNMAAYAMQQGLVDLVVVGADRVTAQGDVANKIGTYGLAVLARAHGIPFYVAAPVSTFDLALLDGCDIPIESRDGDEVRQVLGVPVAPPGVPVLNPAFDVTPHQLITAIVTEKGIIRQPDQQRVAAVLGST